MKGVSQNLFKQVIKELLFMHVKGYFFDRSFILELGHQEAKGGLCGDPA